LLHENHIAIGKSVLPDDLPDGTEPGPRRWGLVAEHKSMLVERELRVMNVKVAVEALAIAWNYLSQTGAIDDSRASAFRNHHGSVRPRRVQQDPLGQSGHHSISGPS
jgi:hypothetical protein